MAQPINQEQENALADLLAEVDAASEVVLGKRDVLGRVPGFYAGLASGTGELPPHLEYPGGKGGKRRKYTRKQRGGAACDNKWVSLAVDSAIVLAGAGAVVGTSYVGFKTLSYYMTTYGIPEATVQIITALYNTLKTLLTDSLPAVASGVASGAQGVLSGFTSLFSAASTLAQPGLPAVGVYRYFFQQGTSASDDAARIAEGVSTGIRDTKTFAQGVVTRSMAKKQQLAASLAQTKQNMRDALTQARDTASTKAFRTMNQASNLKVFACGLIDKAVSGAIIASTIKEYIGLGAAVAGAAAAAVHLDDGEEDAHANGASLPASPVASPAPVDVASPAPVDVAPAPVDVDDEDMAASRRLQELFQGGKRHRKRTMHKRSKKHHKGKKSRKHMHRRR